MNGIFIAGLFAFAAALPCNTATLADAAKNAGVDYGSCVGSGFPGNAAYVRLLANECSIVVPENSMKMGVIQRNRGEFNWTIPDSMVAWARRNNIKVRGHCLVWHSQAPAWFSSGSLSRSEMLAAMKTHITTVMHHFRGDVHEWDVVNEAVDDGNLTLRNSFLVQVIGADFIDSAFVYARQADPDAKLYYNDFSAEGMGAKANRVYNLVSNLKAKRIPIDGVGFQCHFSISGMPSINDIDQNIKRIAALGLRVSFTEVDVGVPQVNQTNLALQGKRYAELMRVFLANRPVCAHFLTWGITDRFSWRRQEFALPFDTLLVKKPAYDSLTKVLSQATLIRMINRGEAVEYRNSLKTGNILNQPFYDLSGRLMPIIQSKFSTELHVQATGKNGRVVIGRGIVGKDQVLKSW